MQPARRPQIERVHCGGEAGDQVLQGLWSGRYPYRTLTIVDPAPGAGGSGGMEYPTFITGGTSVLFNYWPFNGVLDAELVTVHEFGHQFWYGLVGNNEFEEAWLDEGFASYSTGRLMDLAYGPDTSVLTFLGLRLGGEELIRMQNSPRRIYDRIRQPSWSFSPGMYEFYAYTKPELTLRTLENYLGTRTMARVMRTYRERWRFQHPSSDGFYAIVNEVSGRNLGWFFNQITEGTGVIDYEVASLTSSREPPPAGLLDAANGETELVTTSGPDVKTRDTKPYT